VNYLLDSCALLNLANGGVLAVALSLPNCNFYICNAVLREIVTNADYIKSLIKSGALKYIDDNQIPAGNFMELKEKYRLGDGETECLAFAMNQECELVFDDLAARKAAQSLFANRRVTGSIGILRTCVANNSLSETEAYGAYKVMKACGGFLPEMTMEEMFPKDKN